MNIRTATEADTTKIYDIAQQSTQASYAVSPTAIDIIVEEWFDVGVLEDRLDEHVIGVAETDESVVGFAEGTITDDTGELLWLHVHPEERGQHAGTELFEWTRETLLDRGATDVHVRILASNTEGDGFAERFGYERIDQRDTEFGGESWREHIYAPIAEDTGATAPAEPRDVPSTIEADGEERFLADEAIPGDAAPFYPLYNDESYDEQYGYYCSNCGSTAQAADELDRIKCTECGNVHRPDDWDDAYL
ncbi:GNAT family N-acetyltransferase [Halocatena pleomorpha]|uniref:GNAT family N-acetyltransferase n=1 Tax=Halocatena pleomorpha TaxID=1785090 RepID=A0A3P3RHQ7_9EURY|nr:GNAT family N-acetyltransferase [Halocatena pleomorpha]RRJ32478.1 GNAT family N-acetyltransferase [Halocatena pleomorpha]